jgi:hypothetical protein
MSLEEFQATKRIATAEDLERCGYTDDANPRPGVRGFVYVDHLIIEQVTEDWPAKTREAGAYYLLIGNLEWITDDLELLEKRLYEFAKSSGLVEEAP